MNILPTISNRVGCGHNQPLLGFFARVRVPRLLLLLLLLRCLPSRLFSIVSRQHQHRNEEKEILLTRKGQTKAAYTTQDYRRDDVAALGQENYAFK